jgi:hypothetical protein
MASYTVRKIDNHDVPKGTWDSGDWEKQSEMLYPNQ